MSNEKFSTQEQQVKTAGTQNSTQEAFKYPRKKVLRARLLVAP